MYSKHFLKHIILVILLSQMLFSSSNIKKIWVPIGVGDILTFVPFIPSSDIPFSDTISPEITLNGENPITLTVGDTYIEAGATAQDNIDGNLNATITGSVDTTKVGTYTLTYTATDSTGNRAIKKRTIIVEPKEDDHYIHGGKSNNSGEGSYYPYDDEDAKRGLKFNADKAFLLHSVKVYNQVGEASTRIFSLFDSSGNKIASKKVIVPEGESRLVLDFKIPEGSGYTLMADTHKGLYRNTNVNGYPYAIGDVGSIISANESSTDYYYFFYDWAVEELSKIVSIDLQVSQGTDDADEDSSGNMNLGGHGDTSIIPLSNDNKYIGVRFQNLNIPQGATITSATVEFTSMWANNGASDNPAYSIYGDNSDDALSFDDVSHNISSRTKTASKVSFKTPDVASDGAKYNTPDIKSIVQEIVDRKDWQNGNALALILQYTDGNEWRAIKGYETHAQDAAVLHVEYKLGGDNHQHPPSLSDYKETLGLSGYGILSRPSNPTSDDVVPYIPDLTNLDEYDVIYIDDKVSPNTIGADGSKENPKSIYDIFPSIKSEAHKDEHNLSKTIIIALPGEYIIKKNLFFPKLVNDVRFISQKKHQAKLIMAHEPLDDMNEIEDPLSGNDGNWTGTRTNALLKQIWGHDKIQKLSIIGFESYPAELKENRKVKRDQEGKIVPQGFVQPYKDEELNAKDKDEGYRQWNDLNKSSLRLALKHSRNFLRIPDGKNSNNISEKIYMSDMKFHHYEGVIFSGRNSEKFTIDKSLFYHSNGSYLWYMQGWQNAVINTVVYDSDGNVLSIRGGDENNSAKKWTALVAYNVFGATDSRRFRNFYRNGHIGISTEENQSRSGKVHIMNNISVGNQNQYYYYSDGIASDSKVGSKDMFLLDVNINENNNIVIEAKNNITDNQNEVPYNNGYYDNADNKSKDSIENTLYIENIPFKRVDRDENTLLRDYSIVSDNSNIKDKATIENWKPNVDTNGDLRDNKPDIGAFEIK